MSGKGDTQRPEAEAGAYASGYDRIFGKDAQAAKEGGTNEREEQPAQGLN